MSEEQQEPLMQVQAGDTFTDITDIVDELLADPAITEAVSRIRESIEEARCHPEQRRPRPPRRTS